MSGNEWDETVLVTDGFERVYVESERYDWPRSGLADIGGRPHYFEGWAFDRVDVGYLFNVWPANAEAVTWELERWAIYARWDQRFIAGEVTSDSHPGQGGIDARYDELTAALAPHRQVPANSRKLVAEMRFDKGDRYRVDGTDMWFRWHPPEQLELNGRELP
ncbi:hypothetical protein [Nocardia yamanashiensis]|uniref:hypothetical protein n=1 Tax=Nocardia yamanashiensis TaxID=209247 RepID=UPI00082CD8BB|nr:hypothetical protein [Nocardia yamanashiensis]